MLGDHGCGDGDAKVEDTDGGDVVESTTHSAAASDADDDGDHDGTSVGVAEADVDLGLTVVEEGDDETGDVTPAHAHC